MRLSRLLIAFAGLLCAAGLVAQEAIDREAYARDHVRFLVEQLDQWSREFPQQFNAALMKPPGGCLEAVGGRQGRAGGVRGVHQAHDGAHQRQRSH